jgi:hypothetical protein
VFTIEGVEPGSYTLRYGKDAQLVKCEHEVEVPPNVAELRQDLALRTGKLRAQVVASGTGEPIRGAEVEVVRAVPAGAAPVRSASVMMVSMSMASGEDGGTGEETTMTMGQKRVRSDAAGLAEIDDVPAGEWQLQVRHKQFAAVTSKVLTVVERQVTDAGRIEMGAAGQARGKVLGADGKALRLAMVTHRPVGSDEWSEPEMAMGGSFRVQGLVPGRYQLRARDLGGESETYSPVVEVDIVAGETAKVDLLMPK